MVGHENIQYRFSTRKRSTCVHPEVIKSLPMGDCNCEHTASSLLEPSFAVLQESNLAGHTQSYPTHDKNLPGSPQLANSHSLTCETRGLTGFFHKTLR